MKRPTKRPAQARAEAVSEMGRHTVMKITKGTFAFACLLGLGAFAPACAANVDADASGSTDDAISGVRSAKQLTIVGSLDYGQSAEDDTYTTRHKTSFDAYKFSGKAGDKIDLTVTALDGGIAQAWIIDNDFHNVARTGTSKSTAHIATTLTANASDTHYVVFAEKYGDDQRFAVTLKGPAPNFYACQTDADCTVVYAGTNCCNNGKKTAVNASEVDAWEAASSCGAKPKICPLFMVYDPNVPQCDYPTHTCKMVDPSSIRCDGFIANAHHCSDGYTCDHAGINPDVPGRCYETCGGFIGKSCTNATDVCVYGPSCDPAKGGADCSGECKPSVH
jgi:hypothetical protein